jgi:AraC-like DNA-binding protein
MQPQHSLPFEILIRGSVHQNIIRHWHDSLEVTYTVSGSVQECFIDGKSFVTKPGNIFTMNPQSIHSLDLCNAQDRITMTYLFPPEFLNQMVPDIDTYSFLNPAEYEDDEERGPKVAELQECFRQVYHLTTSESSHKNLLKILSLTYNILYIYINDFSVDANQAATFIGDKQFHYLSNVTSFIKENYRNELPIGLIAQNVHLSEGYLIRLFKKYMGQTILQYIASVRLQYAYDMMMHTDANLDEIAKETGFPNVKSFINEFKEVYHVTPHQYRMRMKEKRPRRKALSVRMAQARA